MTWADIAWCDFR